VNVAESGTGSERSEVASVAEGTPPRAWVPGHRRPPSRVHDAGEEEFLGTSRFLGSRDHFPGAAGVP
jgi:hypothetical protein